MGWHESCENTLTYYFPVVLDYFEMGEECADLNKYQQKFQWGNNVKNNENE